MIKKNLPMLMITSVVILIPILIGLVLWNMLPEQVAIHWDIDGNADGFSSRAVAVFVMPIFLVALHWLGMIVTCCDPKNKDIAGKPLTLVLWICPIISLLAGSVIYATAMGWNVSVEIIMPLVLGAMFVVVGNYMPKCPQNYSIGIKLPWTLNNLENWNKTHRLAGVVWVVGGIVIMATALLGSVIIMLAALVVMIAVPVIYSYLLYRKAG